MPDLSLVFDLLAKDRASSEVDKVGNSMKGAGDQADGFGDRVSGMFAGLAAGAAGAGLAVGAAFASALEAQGANTKLSAQLGLDPEESATAGKIAGDLYANNYGDSLESVNDAMKSVVQNMTVDVNDADLSQITSRVLDLASAFDVDVGDATKTVSNLIETGLAPNAQAALDIVTSGFQAGNDAAGDWLDTLNEYSVQFGKFGISGAEASNLISQGMQAGARDSDLVADAIKEFSLRAVDGSTTTAAGFQAIGLNAQDMAEKIGAGGSTAHDALESTLTSLRNMTDPVARAQAATALFGSQAEDLGGALFALDPASAGAAGSIAGVQGASDRLDATLASGLGPRLESLKRGAQQAATEGMTALIDGFTQGKTDADGWQGGLQNLTASVSGALTPTLSAASDFLTGTVAPALGSVFGFLSDHQTTVTVIAGLISGVLAAAFLVWGTRATIAAAENAAAWFSALVSSEAGAAGTQLSALQVVASWVLMGAQAVLQGIKVAAVWTAQIVASAVTGAASFAVQVARVVGGWVLMGAQSLLQAARMAAAWFIALGPVGWVIAAVIGLVALIVANWDTVVSATTAAWDWITGKIGDAWQWIVDKVTGAASAVWGAIESAWDTVKTKTSDAWTAVSAAVSDGIAAVVTFVTGLPGKAVTALASLGSSIAGVASSAWTLFSGAVQTGIATVVTFVIGLPGEIVSAVGGLGSLLLTAGGDLLRGLWNGISGATSWLLGKVGAFFGNLLPGWVKSMLGISSPSKVFAEFGRFTMQGFAAGIDDEAGTALAAAERAMQGVVGVGADLSAGVGVGVGAGAGLGYRPPGYDVADGAGAAAGSTTTITTTINAAPTIPTEDQLLPVYRRAQLLAPRRG